MLILSRVCAEFRDRAGVTTFTIRQRDLLTFLEAPEAIREDPLFDMLLQDGSIEAVRSVEQKKQLEQDPRAGADAEGRKAGSAAGEVAGAGSAKVANVTAEGARAARTGSAGQAEALGTGEASPKAAAVNAATEGAEAASASEDAPAPAPDTSTASATANTGKDAPAKPSRRSSK